MERVVMWDKGGKEHLCHPSDVKVLEAKGWSTSKSGSSSPKSPEPKVTSKKV